MARVFSVLQRCLLQPGFRNPSLSIQASGLGSQGSKYYSNSTRTKDETDPQQVQKANSEAQGLPSEAVFYHPKHNMYVCWHPEVPFPYEMSKPIPQDTALTESSLKIQALTPVKEVFRKKHEKLMIRELMHLTYTAKYSWMGRYGRKKMYVLRDMDPLKQKRDRDYL